MSIPNDPVILLSFVNLKLRDFYSNLDSLCTDLNVQKKDIETKLSTINYYYDLEQNQFI